MSMDLIIESLNNSREKWARAYEEATDVETAYYYMNLIHKVEHALYTLTGDEGTFQYGSKEKFIKKVVE